LVFLTGQHDLAEKDAAVVVAWLIKPVTIERLAAALEQVQGRL